MLTVKLGAVNDGAEEYCVSNVDKGSVAKTGGAFKKS